MTKKEVDEVLHYVAKEIISPLHRDKRTGDEIWDEMIGVPFNKFVTFMHNMINEEKEIEKMYNSWGVNAKAVEEFFGGFVNWEERFYICPECDEPIYESDWPIYKFEDFICPICEWEGD